MFYTNKMFWTKNQLKKSVIMSLLVKRIRMFSIGRVNIEFFPGWKKIKQQRISFVLGYFRMILWKISTTIYLYGFLNQRLGLILGNIFY
jgi:hypothetical protein